MRKPKIPPKYSDLFDRVHSANRLSAVFTRVNGPVVDGKYLHWNKLRYHEPPSDLTLEEWWLGIRLHRALLSKELPITDLLGRPFRYLLTDPMPERLHEIDLGAGGRIEISEQITNPDFRDRYIVSSLMEEAITSSQLEGATTTRRVARDMIRSARQPRDQSERMILNNFVTMERIRELKDKPLSVPLIFELHRLITEETLKDPSTAGRLRRENEDVRVEDTYGEVMHEPPSASELEKRMEAMCAFANGKIPSDFFHPVLRSMALHFWLAYDHPFVDGNGRTARALFYWCMLRHGFWLCEFISISQILLQAPSQYSRAFLYVETDDNDLTYFLLYHLDVIHRAIRELHNYIRRKSKSLRMLERELRGISVFNHRERALINHAIRHPHHEYTIESHRRSHDVVYQTARTDLLHLRDRHLLRAKKVGRTFYFTPAQDLEERLRGVD